MSTPIEVLRKKYADVMDNQAVTNATGWVLPNSAPEFSPDVVTERAKGGCIKVQLRDWVR